MQADEALVGMVEGLRDGADHLEAQGLPQAHRRLVDLDDRVELDAPVSLGAAPRDDVLAEGLAGTFNPLY